MLTYYINISYYTYFSWFQNVLMSCFLLSYFLTFLTSNFCGGRCLGNRKYFIAVRGKFLSLPYRSFSIGLSDE